MSEFLDLIKNHYKWIFSGIGVFLLSIIFLFFKKKFARRDVTRVEVDQVSNQALKMEKSIIETHGDKSPVVIGKYIGGREVIQNKIDHFANNVNNIKIESKESTIIVMLSNENKHLRDEKISFVFNAYIENFINSYRKEDIFKHYVDMTYRYYKIDHSSIGENHFKLEKIETKETIDQFIFRWLDNRDSRQVSILGDFGAGKTSFCKHLTYILAKRHLQDPNNTRMPILISLKGKKELGSIENIICKFLKNDWGFHIDYELFLWLLKSGRIVLILDGFDEMSSQVDHNVRLKSFNMIKDISKFPNKVIIAGRPTFFPNIDEMCQILGLLTDKSDIYSSLGHDLQKKIGLVVEFETIELKQFNDDQVNQLLRSYQKHFTEIGFGDWKKLKHIINTTYNLFELSKRPFLLDLIINTIPEIDAAKAPINIASLYRLYTNFWCDIEWARGEVKHLISTNARKALMEFLAYKMHKSSKTQIRCSEIPSSIFKVNDKCAKNVEWYRHDVGNCTFLTLSDDGLFEFVHKSFMEYFIASKILKDLMEKCAEEIQLSDTIALFISELIDKSFYNKRCDNIPSPKGMTLVPAGPFIYGDEYNITVKKMPNAFFVDKYLVTNREYEKIFPEHKRCKESILDDQPVVNVSYEDAKKYAESIGKRLLSEEEWEKAARGIDGRIFPWGNTADARRCNSGKLRKTQTTPVKTYTEGISPYGCYDMAGNIREWTGSFLSGDQVICRGGSFADSCPVHQVDYIIKDEMFFCRASYRKGENRKGYSDRIGFRLALDV